MNHLLAAAFGSWVSQAIPPYALKWILGLIFIFFAAWILIPDKEDAKNTQDRFGAFLTTLITFGASFFLVEIAA